MDILPGCPGLVLAADAAAVDDGFAGVSEAELIGIVCAWDRVEAHAAARKLAAIAEVARRSPAPEDAEFTANAPDPARQEKPSSPLPSQARTDRPAATEPGGCAPPDPART
jgi:hypothetical protein